jgi:cytoskeletal protein RodZ
MSRKKLLLILVLDLAFLGFVGHRLWTRYQQLQKQSAAEAIQSVEVKPVMEVVPEPVTDPNNPAEVPVDATPAGLENSVVATGDEPAAPEPVGTTPPAESTSTAVSKAIDSRRTFTYTNSNANEVQLVGSFNGWTPQEFQRRAGGQWMVSVTLTPGDYSYNFVVDGKTIRDPNQRRTDEKGRSLLTVAP